MEEKARSFFLHCLTTLWWESGIRELQRGLSGSAAALCGCVWSVVQSPGAVVSKPCSWQIFGETLPQAHESCHRSGLLMVQAWVGAGWPKVPSEGQTLSGPSSQGEDFPLLISGIYFTAAPILVGSSVSSTAGALRALGAGPCRSWRPHPRDAEAMPAATAHEGPWHHDVGSRRHRCNGMVMGDGSNGQSRHFLL